MRPNLNNIGIAALAIDMTSIPLNFGYYWGYIMPFVSAAFLFYALWMLTDDYFKSNRVCKGYTFVWGSVMAFASMELVRGAMKTFIWMSYTDAEKYPTKFVQSVIDGSWADCFAIYMIISGVVWMFAMFWFLPKATEIMSE